MDNSPVVFLSWAGRKSQTVATALAKELRQMLHVKTWISTENIAKGSRWSDDLAQALETAEVGIVCVSKESLQAQWLIFEAGALSRIRGKHVCTLLIDIEYKEVDGPLSQFHATKLEKEDLRKLVKTIWECFGKYGSQTLSARDIDDIFELHWPALEANLLVDAIPTPIQYTRSQTLPQVSPEFVRQLGMDDSRLTGSE